MGIGSWARDKEEGVDMGKRQKHSLVSKYLSIMESPQLFRMVKFSLTNLSDNYNSQTSILNNKFSFFSCG